MGSTTTATNVSLVMIPAGSFLMGCDAGQDCERPVHRVWVDAFALGATQVTNRDYTTFLAATGRPAPPDWGKPQFADPLQPVVSVSWSDAIAYCAWLSNATGRHFRLPTEAEWEYAARGGLAQARYPWGDELAPDGRWMCNIWQGTFPTDNTVADGYLGTAPVDAFDPNGFGLHHVAGNVWEWCADWFSATHTTAATVDPKGPPAGASKVIRGGSYLCHHSYCNRYRVSARTANTPDSSTGNMGFRCAATV
jgi:formylglycine-generating enzyme